jgi:starch phosphorylase
VVLMRVTQVEGDIATFETTMIPSQTGRLGFAIRVSPNHYDNPLTRPVSSLLKWSGR